MLYKLNILIA